MITRIGVFVVTMIASFLFGCAATDSSSVVAEEAKWSSRSAEPAIAAVDTTLPPAAEAAATESIDDPEDEAAKLIRKAAKREKLERDLLIAESKLTKARMEADHSLAAAEEDLRKATSALEIAMKKFEDFEQRSGPLRIDRGRLGLKRAEARVQESEEELQQLEMMYSEEELGDKTAEIVIVRAKRRLEHARWDLNIQRQSQLNLEAETIPLERLQLEVAMRETRETVEVKHRAADAGTLGQRIAILSAESEVARIRSEIDLLDLED